MKSFINGKDKWTNNSIKISLSQMIRILFMTKLWISRKKSLLEVRTSVNNIQKIGTDI
jgi:hypothetical protein